MKKTKLKFHILTVDDEPNVRRVLGTLLEQAGYTTTRAESGEIAMELVRAKDPDLVLTDQQLVPERDKFHPQIVRPCPT
mgnify:CR=1 FL=1